MTDKPKLTDLLDLPWEKLCVRDDVRAAIWRALGEEGPWEHKWVIPPGRMYIGGNGVQPYECQCGLKCNCKRTDLEDTGCPVPPPITEEPEVVAERLRDIVMGDLNTRMNLMDAISLISLHPQGFGPHYWYAFRTTPTQRILTCLLALGGF
jgi:hypothetical protein